MINSCLLAFLTEEESRARQRIERRALRDKANPLEMLDNMFGKYFRVNKTIFKYLLDELSTLPPNKKSFAISPIVKLSACLRFLAEGGYQKGVGKDDEVCLAQSSFSAVLSEVLNSFESSLCPKWILWPNDGENKKITRKFYGKFGLPGVVGCIDGTHINIVAPSERRHLFYNRKGAFSINVMVVCDHDMKIRCIDAAHPGASHDALIWNVSEIRASMEEIYLSGSRNMWLLGLDKIEYLQSHENRDIYHKSFYIIEQYFGNEEEDSRVAPSADDHQYNFNPDSTTPEGGFNF